MNKEEFYKELEQYNIELTNIQKEQLSQYCDFLMEYNKHTNLTAIKDEEGIYLKHFFDSASVAFYKKFNNENILDIGTGPGFPGMVIKILFPNIKLTLLDSNNKKTTFLKLLAEKINVDVEIINDRAENLDLKEKYDVILSRAVAELRTLVELGIPLLKVNGLLIFQKAHIEDEIQKSFDTIELLNGKLIDVYDLKINEELGNRCLVIIEKVGETPKIYPRKYDKILKYPLKKSYK